MHVRSIKIAVFREWVINDKAATLGLQFVSCISNGKGLLNTNFIAEAILLQAVEDDLMQNETV